MTFLNPWFLLGLAGMAVPLVIHLLSRRTARRVEFSSLEFLRKLERRSMRRVRIRQLLLLLLRMLLIGAVAIAMARPTVTGPLAAAGRGATSAALVVDASWSMGTLFDEARERATGVLGTFADGDEVVVLLPGARGERRTDFVRDLGLARERVEAAEPGGGAADLPAAIREAVRGLEDARHPNREVHVVSDFQAGSWDGLGEDERLPAGVRLFLHPVGKSPPPNAWIESVDFAGQILEKGTPIEVRAVVASGAGSDAAEVDVELEIDARVADRRRIDLAPSSRVALTFRETFAEDGLHLGAIVLRGADGPEDDDRRWFTMRTAGAVPVTLVCADERIRRYLQAALAPAGEAAGSFAVRVAGVEELASASRDREAVIVAADVERFPDRALEGLKSFLSEGGGLLVLPGPRTDAAAWGRGFLPKFLPGSFADLIVAEEPFGLGSVDPSHALFELFRGGEGGLSDVRFTRALRFRAEAGTTVLAGYTNGAPAVVEAALLPGRVLLLTSSLDPAWSDLPLTGAFLPLLHEAVRYLSETSARAAEQLDVGQGAVVHLPSVPEGGRVTLRAPDGSARVLAPAAGPAGYGLELAEATVPGHWVFESAAGDTLAALAASVPARESDPSRVEPVTIEERLAPVGGAVLEGGAGLAREVRQARVGREIGRLFLWGAAALLLAEMLLAARLRGRGEEEPAA